MIHIPKPPTRQQIQGLNIEKIIIFALPETVFESGSGP